MKIKNLDLETLLALYSKLIYLEYDYEIALKISKDGYSLEASAKAFHQLRDSIVKKYTDDEGRVKNEFLEEFKEKYEKLAQTTQDLQLTKIPFDTIKSIKFKGTEAKVLDDYSLVEVPEVAEEVK